MLLSCSPKDDSVNIDDNTGGVDYEFTIKLDDKVYAIKGNTSKDSGFITKINNSGFAMLSANQIILKISDPTYYNHLQGGSINLLLQGIGGYSLGNNKMSFNLPYYPNYNASPGTGALKYIYIQITDLGTPSVGNIGDADYKYGNTIKGNYSGTIYSVPSGSNNATIPHSFSIDFKVPRLY